MKPAPDPSPTALTGVGKCGVSYESDPLSLEGEGWGEGEEHEYIPLSAPTGGETQRGGAPTPNDASNLSPTDQEPVEAGFKPAPNLSPTEEDTSFSNLSPDGGETQRGGTPHHPAPSTQNPTPGLNRRQRRELQRQAKRKRQKSHRPRAPTDPNIPATG